MASTTVRHVAFPHPCGSGLPAPAPHHNPLTPTMISKERSTRIAKGAFTLFLALMAALTLWHLYTYYTYSPQTRDAKQIGRASCRERVIHEGKITVGAGSYKKKKTKNKHGNHK